MKRRVLSDVHKFLKKKKFSWEVIISNDGSTDESSKLVKKQIKGWKNFRFLENKHGGKPLALLHGIKKAKGEYVLFTDMDQSTPIKELDKLIPFIKGGYEIVIGSRGMSRENFPFYRKLGAMVFIGLRKALILSDINDTQCGFKLFERRIVSVAFPKLEFFRRKQRVEGWKVTSFDVELLHIINSLGHKIKEIVVEWNDEDTSGSKGGNLARYVRESWEMFSQILRVKLNDMRGFYSE